MAGHSTQEELLELKQSGFVIKILETFIKNMGTGIGNIETGFI